MTPTDRNELKTIALRNLQKIPTVRGDEVGAFLQVMLIWLAEWVGDKQFRKDIKPGYCAFVLAPEILSEDLPGAAEEMPQFKEDTPPTIGGNVYLTDYALNTVWRLRFDCQDLADVIKALRHLRLSHLPFVAFDVDAQGVYVYLEGPGTVSSKFELRGDIRRPFTIEVFIEMLGDIYNQSLKYPAGYPPIWHDPKNRIPCKETELVIQGHIFWILRARAQGSRKCTAEPEWLTFRELPSNAGRADIAVYKDTRCIVVSELKVLRHCHFPCPHKRRKRLEAAKSELERQAALVPRKVSDQTNVRWALRGARQAARYKAAESAPAALILYDMREEDADLRAAMDHCDANDVRCVRYYLQNELPDEG